MILLSYAAATPQDWIAVESPLLPSTWNDYDRRLVNAYKNAKTCLDHNSGGSWWTCLSWWGKESESWQKATGVLLVVSAIIGVFAVIWSLVALIGCCCRSWLTEPLPAIALLAAATSVAPIIVVAVHVHGMYIGRSTICAIAGAVGYFLAFIFAVASIKFRKPRTVGRRPNWEVMRNSKV